MEKIMKYNVKKTYTKNKNYWHNCKEKAIEKCDINAKLLKYRGNMLNQKIYIYNCKNIRIEKKMSEGKKKIL